MKKLLILLASILCLHAQPIHAAQKPVVRSGFHNIRANFAPLMLVVCISSIILETTSLNQFLKHGRTIIDLLQNYNLKVYEQFKYLNIPLETILRDGAGKTTDDKKQAYKNQLKAASNAHELAKAKLAPAAAISLLLFLGVNGAALYKLWHSNTNAFYQWLIKGNAISSLIAIIVGIYIQRSTESCVENAPFGYEYPPQVPDNQIDARNSNMVEILRFHNDKTIEQRNADIRYLKEHWDD